MQYSEKGNSIKSKKTKQNGKFEFFKITVSYPFVINLKFNKTATTSFKNDEY